MIAKRVIKLETRMTATVGEMEIFTASVCSR